MLTDFIDPKKITYLPNTAGCFTAEDAIRTLRLAREAGGWDLVKLEVLGEAKTLYPDMRETLRATEILVKEGFEPMVYCVDDPIAAKQLEEAGAVAIMPLGAPIGSGLGIQNRVTIRLIVEGANVPVLVDAGVGTASDAAVAMELGCDGVLMNTAIAEAKDPVLMARAMKLAVEAGRLAYLAGRMAEAPLRRSVQPAGGADLSRGHDVRRHWRIEAGWDPQTPKRSFSRVRNARSSMPGSSSSMLDCAPAFREQGAIAASRAEAARLRSSIVSISISLKPAARQVALDPAKVTSSRMGLRTGTRGIVREHVDRTRCPKWRRDILIDAIPDDEEVAAAIAEHPARFGIGAHLVRKEHRRRTGRRPGRSCDRRRGEPAHRLPEAYVGRTQSVLVRRSSIGALRSVAMISASGSARCSASRHDARSGGRFQDELRP